MTEPNIRDLQQKLKRAQSRIHAENAIRAQVQDSSDLPANLLRVFRTDEQASVVIPERRFSKNLWVNLRYNAAGFLYVSEIDVSTTAEYFGDVGSASQPLIDGSQAVAYWDANNFKAGAVIPAGGTDAGTLKLWIMPFWWNGSNSGTTPILYDPSASLPTNPYEFCWIKIGISTLDGGVVIAVSTPIEAPTAFSLTPESLRNLDLGAGVIPLYGVSLAYGQTDIRLSRFVPVFPFWNGTPGYNDRLARLQFADTTELTITSGSITVTQPFHTVDTESNAASDDLDEITAPTNGYLTQVYLAPADGGRTVNIRHIGGGTGNIRTWDGSTIALDEAWKLVRLTYLPLLSYWVAEAVGSGTSTSYYQTIQDNGSDKTQRGKTNFVAGSNVTLAITDDAGNNRTTVEISATGAGADFGVYVTKWQLFS